MTTRTSRASKRWMIAAAAAVACGSTLALAGPVSAGPGTSAPSATRVAGADRYTTAVAVANAPTLKNSCSVVFASGTNFPDGLSASILGQPVLLTDVAAMPAATSAELARRVAFCATQGSKVTVNIVGGPAVISSAQRDVIAAMTTADPVRLAGVDRYTTAIAVANKGNANPSSVILAAGQNFPDALAGGVLAQNKTAPIILNDGAALRPEVRAYLVSKNLTLNTVYVLGGTTVMPASIVAELQGLGVTVTRLGGADRAATATAIAGVVAPTGPAGVVVVNGNDFPDALTAAPLAGSTQPILLVEATSIPAATAAYHVGFCSTIKAITAIGGTSVIADAVVTGAVGAATCAAPAVTSAVLSTPVVTQAYVLAQLVTPTQGVTFTALRATLPGTAGNNWTIKFTQAPDATGAALTLNRGAIATTAVADPATNGIGGVVNVVIGRAAVTTAANPFTADVPSTVALTETVVSDFNNTVGVNTRFTAQLAGTSAAVDALGAAPLANGAQTIQVVVTFADVKFLSSAGATTATPVTLGLFTGLSTSADVAAAVTGITTVLAPNTVTYTFAGSLLQTFPTALTQIRFDALSISDGVTGVKNPAPVAAVTTR